MDWKILSSKYCRLTKKHTFRVPVIYVLYEFLAQNEDNVLQIALNMCTELDLFYERICGRGFSVEILR